MKLIVGLGNPGRKYEGTRHNVGFQVISELGNRYDVGRPRSKFNAEIVETIIKMEKTALMCPLTFMNLSGQSVRAAMDYFKLSLDDLLVICDDLNLPTAKLRLRSSGSAGGQNGLADIIGRLGSQQFSRLRIGIDRPPPEWEASNYVLGRFDAEETATIEKSIKVAVEAVEVWVEQGIQKTMSQFNPDPEEIEKRALRRLKARDRKSQDVAPDAELKPSKADDPEANAGETEDKTTNHNN